MMRAGDYARQVHIAEKIDGSTRPWRIREGVKEGKFMAEEEGGGMEDPLSTVRVC